MTWTRTFTCDGCGKSFEGQRDRWEGNYCPETSSGWSASGCA